MQRRNRAVERGAAHHHVDAVAIEVSPDALPQQLDGPLGAVSRQNTGAAKLDEAQTRMPRNQLAKLEFAFGIEAAAEGRLILPQQPVGADDAPVFGVGQSIVDHDQMVARIIESIRVDGFAGLAAGRGCAKLFEKHLEPHFLRRADLGGAAGKAHLKGADTPPARRTPSDSLLTSKAQVISG
jgi:hypothetical protein